MKSMLLPILIVVLPTLAFGQSLADVAKKEKERREKNKVQGKEARVISEDEIFPEEEEEEGAEGVSDEAEAGSASASSPPAASSSETSAAEEIDEESYYEEDGNVPTTIPPDLPLEERLAIFERMKRHYDQQVREIDTAIAENNERLRQLEARIGATSAAGGAGLPVAPQTGTGAESSLMTGQESQSLIEEQNKLRAANEQLTQRKEQLKLDLQTKGRVAGIPPGYLRF